MLSAEDGSPNSNGDSLLDVSVCRSESFPFEAVMDCYDQLTQEFPGESVDKNLVAAISTVLAAQGSYSRFAQNNQKDLIKSQIERGLLAGVEDFTRNFEIAAAENQFRHMVKMQNSKPLEALARYSVEAEMRLTRTRPRGSEEDTERLSEEDKERRIDIEEAVRYLIRGLFLPPRIDN